MKQYRRGDNMHHIDNLYDEIRVIREQLLNRILIQLSEGTEEYNLVLRKLNELQN